MPTRKSITMDIHSLATVRFSARRDEIARPGTGFILRRSRAEYFLVTALHMLTGRHWQTKKLGDSGFIPEEFLIKVPCYKEIKRGEHRILWIDYVFKIVRDEERLNEEVAPWLVHPEKREDVDVAVMPLLHFPEITYAQLVAKGLAEATSDIFAVDWEHEPKSAARVGDDIFVVGFPENIRTTGELPIWKRGSIASEPDIPIDGLPYVLVDTGTRGGMSGAPVLLRGQAGETPRLSVNLFGIYSARFGADDVTSQLGIVWKREVISDILEKPTLGRASLCTRIW